MAAPRLEVGGTLRATREEFSDQSGTILRLTLLFSALNGATALLTLAGGVGWAVSMGIAILLGAAYTGMITGLICLRRGRAGEIGELWEAVKPVLARLIWVTLVAAVGVIAGMFAFILPGLALATFWSVSAQAVMVERRGVFDALGRSFALVRGNAWPAFGFLAVLGLISVLLLLLVFIVCRPLGDGIAYEVASSTLGNLVSTPFLAVGSAVLYRQLTTLERGTDEPAATDPESGLPPDLRP